MKTIKNSLFFLLMFLLLTGSVFAEQTDDQKVELIRINQEKQKQAMKNYNMQVQELHDSFKDQIAELGRKETTDRRRNQIITEINKAEQELKVSFQTEMNILREEEKALRAKEKEEPEIIPLKPEEDRPLTPEEILQRSEEHRLEMKDKLIELQTRRAEEKEKGQKRKGSIGQNLRDESKDEDKEARFKEYKRKNKNKSKLDLDLRFNKSIQAVQDVSENRRNQTTNKFKSR